MHGKTNTEEFTCEIKTQGSGNGENNKFSFMEIFATFVAAFSFLCIGLLRSYTSPAISSMQKEPEIFNTTTMSKKEAISWIASSPPLASFVGTIISGPLLQFCGRQKTIMILTLPYIIGWALIGLASTIFMVLMGRLLTGLAAGVATASAQLYVSECVRPEVRGTLGFLPSMMLALGVLVGFSASTIDVEWRELAFIMGSLPTALFFMTLFVPESPCWLIMKEKNREARQSLGKFRGTSANEGDIDREFEALKDAINQDKRKKSIRRASVLSVASEAVISYGRRVANFFKILKKRQIWLPAFIAVMLMMFQQFGAANVVIYFLSVLLEYARPQILNNDTIPTGDSFNNSFSEDLIRDSSKEFEVLDHNVGSVIVAAVQFLAFFLSLPLIDRMGRKILLIISANLMALSLGILGFYYYCNANIDTSEFFVQFIRKTYSWLPLTCLSLFIASYSIGFGPVPFIIMSEIFPAQARSYLCSLTSFSNHFFLFIVIKSFPTMIEWVGPYGTFWAYAGTSLLSILLVTFVLPETKGKTLTEIEKGFTKETKPLLIDRRDSYAVGLP